MPINVDHYEELAGEVLKVYEQAEQTMMRRVANRLNKGVTQPGWTENKYGEMKDVSRQMSSYVDSLSKHRGEMQKQFINQAYTDARKAAISDAQTFTQLSEIQGLTPNTVKVVNIMAELDRSMDAADRMILRKVNDEYAGIVGRASALVATGSITTRDAVKQELEQFANRGITSFVDNAGRAWDMETYAEMATLTAIERATREGYLDSMHEFGYDLAQISDHYGACPICEAWQGVVVSISGTSRSYPSLQEAESSGVFHPRCMHDLAVYHEGISPTGRHYPRPVKEASPGYSVRAQQRHFERMERLWKRRMAVAGTPQEERAAYARVRMYQQRIRDLVDEYNETVPREWDILPRKYWREGGRVKLSASAAKLKPFVIPPNQQAKPGTVPSILGETKAFRGAANTTAVPIVTGNNISLFWKSREEITSFYTSMERSNGIKIQTDADGSIIGVKMSRKAFNALDELTRNLAERSTVVDEALTRDYAEINAIISKRPIYFSKYDRQDIPDFAQYARHENHVKLTLNPKATSIDTIYEELSYRFPQHFSSDVYSPSDRLHAINYAMDVIRNTKTVPVREAYGEEGVKMVRDELWKGIMKGYVDVRAKAVDAVSRRGVK